MFHNQLELFTATGSKGSNFHTDYSISNNTLYVLSLLAPDGTTEAELTTLLRPMMNALTGHNSALTPETMGYTTVAVSTWYDEFQNTLGPALVNASMVPVVGARFLPRTAVSSSYHDDNATLQAEAVTSALRTMMEGGNFTIGCAAVNVNNKACSGKAVRRVAPNAVFNAWRTSLASCFGYSAWNWQTMDATSWDNVKALQNRIEDVVQPALAAAMPMTGAYMNEANWNTLDWQMAFYGPKTHYEKLLAVKNRFDPESVLHGLNAVVSEGWEIDGDGRLCRK